MISFEFYKLKNNSKLKIVVFSASRLCVTSQKFKNKRERMVNDEGYKSKKLSLIR
jgi:hypothetical protein